MKKALLLLIAPLLLWSCGNNNLCTIDGHLGDPNFEGKTVIFEFDGKTIETQLANGLFSIAEKVKTPTLCNVHTEIDSASGMYYYGVCVLEPGTVYLDLGNDSLSGTPNNDLLYSNVIKYRAASDQLIQRYYMQADQMSNDPEALMALTEQTEDRYEYYAECMKEGFIKLYNENKENSIGLYAITAIADEPGMTLGTLQSIMGNPSPKIAQDSTIKAIITRLQCIENTSEGKHFSDFDGIDYATGQASKLGTMIEGKLAVVDFWASWCSPCKQEIKENLIRIYKDYEKKGVTVIGVDVWDAMDKHAHMVKELGIPYPQLIDTTRNATNLYGVDGIPTILLIDRNGTILKRNLRGEAIEEAVKEALEAEKE